MLYTTAKMSIISHESPQYSLPSPDTLPASIPKKDSGSKRLWLSLWFPPLMALAGFADLFVIQPLQESTPSSRRTVTRSVNRPSQPISWRTTGDLALILGGVGATVGIGVALERRERKSVIAS